MELDETVESMDVVRGIVVAGGSCREGLDEVDIVGEVGGELVNETPLKKGSLAVLGDAIGCECACACEAVAPFSAISSFSASAAAASRISSSRGSGAARLAGLGTRTRSGLYGVDSTTSAWPWTWALRLAEGDEGCCGLETAGAVMVLRLLLGSTKASGLVGRRTGSETVCTPR